LTKKNKYKNISIEDNKVATCNNPH